MDVFIKQPNEVLDYDVDMSAWFEGTVDDIDTVTISVRSLMEAEPTLVIGPGVHPEHVLLGLEPVRFKIWIGGGTHLADYVVTCRVTTEQDRTKEIDFKIKVRDR